MSVKCKEWILITLLVILPAMIFQPFEIGYAEPSEGMTTGMDLFRASATVVKKSQGKEITVEESVYMFLGMGYVVGFFDASVITNVDRKNPFFTLPAEGLETEQIMMIAHKYFSEHPEILHESARVCLLEAFSDAFPVEKSGSASQNPT